MKRIATFAVLLTGTLAFTAGCATKKHVANQVQPVINKVNDLDERTAETTRGIRDLDQRAQSGIKGAEDKASAADQKAGQAGQQADQAQQLASKASSGVESLTSRVANLDNYKPVNEASVKFGFNKADLTKAEKAKLDELAQQIPNTKGYIIQIEGSTDSVGDANYNYQLSQRRAAAVTQYLAQKYQVPAHKIYIIGLGKDNPVAKNNSSKGRAENRRVDVRLMTNIQDQNAQNNANPNAQGTQPPAAAASPQR